jgi:formamidopyrimidine-DNA glycosylase
MPELPEVETVRRVLDERLRGLKITSYEVGKPTFYRKPPAEALAGLVGATVEAVRRRGKYLVLALSGGKELTLHLGMSGRIVLGGAGPHTRFRFSVEGTVVNFHDARRFGRVGCELPEFGPEPLEGNFTPAYLFKALRKRRAPVKAMLMDQAVVAGLGNIYATEALFEAGIRPGRAGGLLSRADCERLVAAIKRLLALAVELRGSTLDDSAYLDPLGQAGGFQNVVAVYGRKVGRCGHALKATRKPISGRTSLYCPVCQK